MEDIGLVNQGLKWVFLEGYCCSAVAVKAAGGLVNKVEVFVGLHWPRVCYGCGRLCGWLCLLLVQWKECVFRGFKSVFGLGTVALLIVIWSWFLSLTSVSCLVYVLVSMGAAGCAVHYLGYTPGLFIVGLFAILVLWMYANFWTTGLLFIVGGYVFSLNHARLVILMATIYALYFVKNQAGWSGVFVSINLAFLSNDALNCMIQWSDN
ncbi:hypothetical protein HanLR1_Chr08g0287861 [Helianthus annuus]|nr:hypothetical protein HanLR1_Chr08g0287861 [Helianthus annuus]